MRHHPLQDHPSASPSGKRDHVSAVTLRHPELASLILSYLDTDDLTRCARVSRVMHDFCIPILWKTLDIPGGSWINDREFHRGLARYGKLYPVEQLRLTCTVLQDFDITLLAKNCTRLKHLDLSYTQFDPEDLRILIHSDPYGFLDSKSSDRPKTSKAKAQSSIRRIRGSSQHTQDMAEIGEYDDSGKEELDRDVNAIMRHYQQFLETNATPGRVNQCTSVEPSTTLDPKMNLVQSFGPVSVKSSASLDCAGSDHSAKFKTWFPFYLESLNVSSFLAIDGPACLEIVSLLGPQLKRLVLNDIHSVTDQALIKLVKRCPNLVELQLERTGITDEFLKWFSREFRPSDFTSCLTRQRRSLQRLSFNTNDDSSTGLISIIRACRSSVNTLSMQNMRIDGSVLVALVRNPAKQNTEEVSVAAPYLTAAEYTMDHVPLTTDRFSPNSVLTSINLSECGSIPNVGLQTLFRFATELAYIELGGCGLDDDTLVVLVEAYRSRMKALGFGVPAAWREHIAADERAQAMDQMDSTKAFQDVSTASISSDHRDRSDHGSQLFRTGRVPGGLRRLSLPRCYNITNMGVRAILRSCVGLESLDISDSRNLTLQLFQGPWACTELTNLTMRGMILEVATSDPTTIYHEGTFTGVKEVREERLESLWRFPLAITAYPEEEDDYDKNEHYDHIMSPPDPFLGALGSEDSDSDQYETDGSADFITGSDNEYEGSSGDEGSSIDDEGRRLNRYWRERAAFSFMMTRHRVPREVRNNNPRQRAILRAFYSKLGHLTQLRTLDMGFCKFRVRVQDGLELVLPGLQQNLIEWNLNNESPYRLLDPEMKFFGKYFGFGRDFAPETAVFQDGREVEARAAQLQFLIFSTDLTKDVHPSILHWAGRQGFSITNIAIHLVRRSARWPFNTK